METGQVKQVAAFEKLLSFCNAHGAMYNPGNESVTITAMTSLLTSAQESLDAVKSFNTAYKHAVNVREETFTSLPSFMTRVVNMLAVSGASPETVKEAYFFLKRFRPAGKDRKAVASLSDNDAAPARTRSTSQLDFDAKADNFAAFVKVVTSVEWYNPNEEALTAQALHEKVATLFAVNSAVINAWVALSNARAMRNRYLNRIHEVATSAKKYVKALFGYQSVGYQQVSGLSFVKRKIS